MALRNYKDSVQLFFNMITNLCSFEHENSSKNNQIYIYICYRICHHFVQRYYTKMTYYEQVHQSSTKSHANFWIDYIKYFLCNMQVKTVRV